MPSDVNGYVLAGGKSSRMGRDKALLELAGKPLVFHAVVKLQRVCHNVFILGSRPELETYAPLVRDLHEGCGPLGGIEAALTHSARDWNLFMPVDMPFIPSALLKRWMELVLERESAGARLAMFTVYGRPQPAVCLLHKDVAAYVRQAIDREEFKVLPVLEAADKELAKRYGVPLERVFLNLPWDENESFDWWKDAMKYERMPALTTAQQAAKHLWFANLNTPEEFAEAEQFVDALDT